MKLVRSECPRHIQTSLIPRKIVNFLEPEAKRAHKNVKLDSMIAFVPFLGAYIWKVNANGVFTVWPDVVDKVTTFFFWALSLVRLQNARLGYLVLISFSILTSHIFSSHDTRLG